MTPQQIYDTVARHLYRQGVRSYENGLCWYRGPNGTMCAVGCLIPDELYDPAMEGHGISVLLNGSSTSRSFGDVLPPYFAENIWLLESLQRVHDNQSPMFERPLVEVALQHGLKPMTEKEALHA